MALRLESGGGFVSNETWKQDYTVTVNPEDNTFAGVGVGTNGETGEVNIPVISITGKFNADNTVT